MHWEKRYQIIKDVAEEIVTKEELKQLLKKKEHPTAYDGFEPSGLAHLPFGIYRPLLLKEFMKAGIKFKLLLADSYAWINNKMGGDLEKIQDVGKYFLEVWKAAGVDFDEIEIVWHMDFFKNPEYWKRVIRIGKSHTEARTKRALTIAGRDKGNIDETAQLFYPSMQCSDIFQLDVDIAQLGMDQRKVNMLARDVAQDIGEKKPIAIHHHMLMGLEGPKEERGFDEDKAVDQAISSKMSKSQPRTSIYVHDSKEDIHKKIKDAYCPKGQVKSNPILDYTKEIIFRAHDEFTLERKEKFGGDMVFRSYNKLEKKYKQKDIHPLDLKKNVARILNDMIKPIRNHFKEDERARTLYEKVRSYEITR